MVIKEKQKVIDELLRGKQHMLKEFNFTKMYRLAKNKKSSYKNAVFVNYYDLELNAKMLINAAIILFKEKFDRYENEITETVYIPDVGNLVLEIVWTLHKRKMKMTYAGYKTKVCKTVFLERNKRTKNNFIL